MASGLPHPSRRLIAAALLVWMALAVAAAAVIGDGFWPSLADDVLQAMAAAALALTGAGALLQIWQLRQWRTRTQWVAFDLLSQSVRQARLIAVQLLEIGDPGQRHRSSAPTAFKLPVSELGSERIREACATIAHRSFALVGTRAAMDEIHAARERAHATTAELEGHADKLWTLDD